MENIYSGFMESIGNTPLIRLKKASEITGCEIFGKAEFMNPGGSVKDRAAKAIIEHAERSGELKDGGTIVEGTAGNTGISLAMCANARGYKTVIVLPETQSQEKKDMLRICGADLRLVPAVPYKDPNNYVRYSEKLSNDLSKENSQGVIWANQFDNISNQEGHYVSTGPEIWKQTSGKPLMLTQSCDFVLFLPKIISQFFSYCSLLVIGLGRDPLPTRPPFFLLVIKTGFSFVPS